MPRSFAVNNKCFRSRRRWSFRCPGCADGVDVLDQVTGTRASAHNSQRDGVIELTGPSHWVRY